jgi:hypothetical protein
VTGFLYAKHSLDPRDDFMAGRVRGLVEIDDSRGDVGLEIALVGSASTRYWGEVAGTNEYCRRLVLGTEILLGSRTFIIVLQQ